MHECLGPAVLLQLCLQQATQLAYDSLSSKVSLFHCIKQTGINVLSRRFWQDPHVEHHRRTLAFRRTFLLLQLQTMISKKTAFFERCTKLRLVVWREAL